MYDFFHLIDKKEGDPTINNLTYLLLKDSILGPEWKVEPIDLQWVLICRKILYLLTLFWIFGEGFQTWHTTSTD